MVSSVKAVFELGEVARDVVAADHTVGAGDCSLDVAERGVDPLEGRRARRGWPASRLDRLVGASGVGHAAETRQPVADHRTSWIEAALGEAGDRMAPETSDPPQLQANRLALGRRLVRG